uniref:Si:dkey-19b23.12 n=1 Tax=Xiphophorus couchianus TaxID=32473 RepID=A0A3B5L1F8_9TELE
SGLPRSLHSPLFCACSCVMIFIFLCPLGAVYLNECPVQEKIPIYLIVSGVFIIVLNLLSCLPGLKLSQYFYAHISFPFLTGNIWIYSIYQPEYNKNATDVSRYCNKTLYLFAFWNTTLVYILVILFVLTGCCVLFCFFLGSCYRGKTGWFQFH